MKDVAVLTVGDVRGDETNFDFDFEIHVKGTKLASTISGPRFSPTATRSDDAEAANVRLVMKQFFPGARIDVESAVRRRFG